MMHGTKFAVPAHLYTLAKRNADAVAQITKDAYNFVFSRCNKDLGLATVVTIGLATLTQEYESGEHRPAGEVMAEIARENEETFKKTREAQAGRDERRAAAVAELVKAFDLERIDRVANALYAANYEIVQPGGDCGTSIDDSRVNAETRTQYRWAAVVALRADANL